MGVYRIMNYQCEHSGDETVDVTLGNCSFRRIGTWEQQSRDSGTFKINEESIQWPFIAYERPLSAPTSSCSEPCDDRLQVKIQEQGSCCFYCQTCNKSEIILNDSCVQCQSTYWPTFNKSECVKLPQQYMRWQSAYALVPICLAIVGTVLTVYIIVSFVKNNDTPIVKASGRELSYMCLAGLLIAYAMTFILLLKPTAFSCALQRSGVGFGFAVMYSALLTKTNRIARIFEVRCDFSVE